MRGEGGETRAGRGGGKTRVEGGGVKQGRGEEGGET